MMAARGADLGGPARRGLAQYVSQVGPGARRGTGRRAGRRAPSRREKATALDQPDGVPRAACSLRDRKSVV